MTDGEGWRRLSVRVVWLDLIRVVISLATGYLGIVVSDEPVWALVAGACGGLLTALLDLRRWQTTRYRITPERVEMRTGWLSRKHRTVSRDRIRSVDSSARLLQRLLGLRTVHIGSGETESSFKLDALDHRHAALVQRELMPGSPSVDPASPDPVPAVAQTPTEAVLTRFRRSWIPLNVVSVWAVFAIAGPLFGLNWLLRALGVDLPELGRDLIGWDGRGPVANIALVLLIAYPLGVVATTVAFLLENGNFRLVRTGTAPDTALVTRRGLLNTRTVQRTDSRMRGIAVDEPLVWRWLRLARTKVLSSGLGAAAGEASGGDILPRIRLAEAHDLAAKILPDGARPLEAALARHPRGALTRRLGMAVYGPALISGAVLVFTLTGVLPGSWWLLPLALIPVTLPLAVVAYRSLGHAVDGDYLVVRHGIRHRRTVALQRRAVIGWTVQQSVFQRWGGRMTVGVATAAGARHYESPDMSEEQALTFITKATPDLAAAFVLDDYVERSGSPSRAATLSANQSK
ncbi:membrane protein [Actinoplanes lobatus]|uniref:Membrane protein n=1 Tax=Actinoplanes lobatus TaxID=113568 RepID=A0A7W7HIL3_9ACTN|nr:PH domain-containing protein [Actinoplanes lobatus]MBB4751194.1 putative membrane protein [Actinoplanes lobatus]GGN95758.1 membrane protein [Actinoplanes lobatus]GIE44271.1 membrane protein [Actinoplanes lobatus]